MTHRLFTLPFPMWTQFFYMCTQTLRVEEKCGVREREKERKRVKARVNGWMTAVEHQFPKNHHEKLNSK